MADTFRHIYDEHFRFVWRSLRRLGVPEGDVADAVQRVFLTVHRKLGDFEGRSKMSTWIFGITMRVASDHRRSAVVRHEIATEHSRLADRPDPGPDAAAQAELAQKQRLLDTLLDELPEEQRLVFVLFELEGLTGIDVAELVGAPVGTVHSRLRLARESFRRGVERLDARDRFRVQAEP